MAAAPLPEGETGWYLYGVVRGGAGSPAADVVALAEGEVAGLARRVSLAEFDEATLPERLADAAWLERAVRAHEQVLEDALGSGAVVPCRLCTVYRGEDELRSFLATHRDALVEALDRVEGRVELGVKAFAASKPAGGEAARAETGRAYLEARRHEQQARRELAHNRAEVAARLHERLSAAADEGVLLPLQSREASGREAEMVCNGAYLVADRVRFEDALAAAARDHGELELELTGPWPPYNFVPEELGRS